MFSDLHSYGFVSTSLKRAVLHTLSDLLLENLEAILKHNQTDLDTLDIKNPMYDRLLLDSKRVEGLVSSIQEIVKKDDPVGRILEKRTLKSGILAIKETVPLGVVGMIYESRPNVTIDAFCHSFMAGNGCVLKGGKEAHQTNTIFTNLIHQALEVHDLSPKGVALMPLGREGTAAMCKARGYIDVIIPRGSQNLIDFVVENSLVPVIETGAGVVHCYLDNAYDHDMAKRLITNAKARRVSVCNALDVLVVHADNLEGLNDLLSDLRHRSCAFLCDETSMPYVNGAIAKDHHGREYLSLTLGIQTVSSLQEAISYVSRYSSKHSEMIITNDKANAEIYLKHIDAACVYHNASVAFSDGGEFGLGGEIGISTQKLHARGPFAMESLVSFKWKLYGHGEVRG